MTRPLPTLPFEIILEIFRDEDLSESDLARLCLVSRGVLDSVRVTLYDDIDIYFVPPPQTVQHRPRSNDLLEASTCCLLRTLQENLELSLLVQNIEIYYTLDDAPSPSRIFLPIPLGVSMFLELVPNLKSVTIGNTLSSSLAQILNILGDHAEKIQELYIWSRIEREHGFTATNFPQLKKLLASQVEDGTGTACVGLVHLEDLSILCSVFPYSRVDLLEQSKSTLKELGINAGFASTLDYSGFTQLRYLHLHDYEVDEYASIRHSDERPNFDRFWSKLQQAPTLSVLSFEGERYNGRLEEDLFGSSVRPGVQLQNIRRIRFEESIPLDRIARLIHAPLLPNLRQVVVDYAVGDEESPGERLARIEAASTLCSTRGIDLLISGWTG
ncbi:hypothetical protein JCM3765_004329 [Sporobolomyces pararoseus]